MKQSLGLLEVSGPGAGHQLRGCHGESRIHHAVGPSEKTNGSGWTVINIAGDVASVQSAIATGASWPETQGGLVAQK